MTDASAFWAQGSLELAKDRDELFEKIAAVRAALEVEEDPEEASQLALLLRTLEADAVRLGSADDSHVLS